MTPEAEAVIRELGDHALAVTIAEIADETGLPRRKVEEAIEELRLAGEPIVACGRGGVALTADPAELEAYLGQRRHRAASIHRGTLALRTTLRRIQAPQGTLWRTRS